MEVYCTSIYALAAKGIALGLKTKISAPSRTTYHDIAETVEAIIGAVYIDSQDEELVSKAITSMGLVSNV